MSMSINLPICFFVIIKVIKSPHFSPLAVKEEESMDTTETKSADEVEEVDPLDAFMRQINTEIRGPRPGAAAVSHSLLLDH
jgi:hypothetical protein